jgi:dipeptidyl aminopeptidase/acylaminoacyl peptidase
MSRFVRRFQIWIFVIFLLLIAAGIFFATSNNPNIWPLRNTLSYHVTTWWEDQFGSAQSAGEGILRGCVTSSEGQPIPGATVLVSERDGTTHTARTDSSGCYEIEDIPESNYVPVAGAPGYADRTLRRVYIAADSQHTLDLTLQPYTPPDVAPGTNLRLSEPVTVTWPLPQPSEAVRREINYTSGGEPNQSTWLYTPTSNSQQSPTLLAIYPGPADTWEGVSVPLASAGYAVIGIGPEYALDLDEDINELQRLVQFARAGRLPGASSEQIAVLGGSYSGLHAMRMLRRDVGFCAAVLLGPPSDLFDYRRRFEEGSFFPPFGLDQALIALGTPDTSPERYWRNSARYHLRPDMPPILLMHSRDDEIVPFQQSELLAAALERQQIPHDVYFFDGMSHYLRADEPSPQLDNLYTITLQFLGEHCALGRLDR